MVCVVSYFFPPGICPRWIKSLLISREAHSPIPEPSSFRLLGSPLYSLSIRLPASFSPASSHSRPPPPPNRGLPLSVPYRLSRSFFFFFSEFSSMFSAPHEKLALPKRIPRFYWFPYCGRPRRPGKQTAKGVLSFILSFFASKILI